MPLKPKILKGCKAYDLTSHGEDSRVAEEINKLIQRRKVVIGNPVFLIGVKGKWLRC